MAKLSLGELSSFIASFVDSQVLSNPSFTKSTDNIAGLIDKIGKIITLDTSFADKLSMFDGSELSFGKIVEEWQQDLTMPSAYDGTGANALAPHYPSYRPVDYAYPCPKKVIATTVPYNNLERAVHFEEQFISLTAMITKRLYDSYAVYKYGIKRQALGELASLCVSAQTSAGSTAFQSSTKYDVGTLVYNSSEFGIVVKPIAVADGLTWSTAKSGGYVILFDLVETMSAPSDSTSGEAFVVKVKEAVEKASDISEGHSLNGNTLGASEGLVLLVKQGIIPPVEVEVMAGAFHQDKVALPAEIVVVKDFGDADSSIYGILMDRRGLILHNDYLAVKEQLNAEGNFMNYYLHSEFTCKFSRNTFVRVFKSA